MCLRNPSHLLRCHQSARNTFSTLIGTVTAQMVGDASDSRRQVVWNTKRLRRTTVLMLKISIQIRCYGIILEPVAGGVRLPADDASYRMLGCTRRMRSSSGPGSPRPSVLLVMSHRSPSGDSATSRMRPYSPLK